MKKYTKVSYEDYLKKHEEYKEYGISTDHLKPVDMNAAFIPTDVSQKAKGSNSNVNMAHECNLERFGL